MATFGETLRLFRQACNDPHRLNRRLSQERLGRLIGEEMGDLGVSGAAVAYWESGESKINADDRKVLLALIKVLHACGGLKTLIEANRLLELGNYRVLHAEESRGIFEEKEVAGSSIPFLIEDLFAISENEMRTLISKAKEEGPDPSWPRMLAAMMRKVSERISISRTAITWIWIGVLTWWLITPSLYLSIEHRDALLPAMKKYMIGSLVIPLAIGAMVNTRDNEYWKQQSGVKPLVLRLYTYQGAGIGFNIGYFLVYPLALVGYYLNIDTPVWVKFAAVLVSLILGNMAARVVPHNLWRAYGRLKFSDGAIFFVVALLGLLWGFFFLEFYPVLLAPATGIFVILLAITILVFTATRQSANKM